MDSLLHFIRKNVQWNESHGQIRALLIEKCLIERLSWTVCCILFEKMSNGTSLMDKFVHFICKIV